MRIVRDRINVSRAVRVNRTLPDAREVAERVVKKLSGTHISKFGFTDTFGSLAAVELGNAAVEWLPILAAAILDKPVHELFPHIQFPSLTSKQPKAP